MNEHTKRGQAIGAELMLSGGSGSGQGVYTWANGGRHEGGRGGEPVGEDVETYSTIDIR